jgi:hypothetical protein
MGRSIVPAIGWLPGDTGEDIQFLTADGMEYARS